MKHIVKVNNIQEAKDSDIRPIIAMDTNKHLFFERKAAGPQIEFVDLGLSVKWGNANIGATNGNTVESWYGDHYAWGETETKTNYDWSNYKHANGANKLTKYCNNSNYGNNGFTDDLTQLVPEDDVATVTKSAWRMPTKEDFDELLAGTTNSWVTDYKGISGLNGRLFTGNNGNSLFIPAAGYCFGSDICYVGSCCCLWSSSLDLDDPSFAYDLSFDSDYFSMSNFDRCYGLSVRPIC